MGGFTSEELARAEYDIQFLPPEERRLLATFVIQGERIEKVVNYIGTVAGLILMFVIGACVLRFFGVISWPWSVVVGLFGGLVIFWNVVRFLQERYLLTKLAELLAEFKQEHGRSPSFMSDATPYRDEMFFLAAQRFFGSLNK